MEILPIDVSERLYKNYSATLMHPEPLTEEMRDVNSNFRRIYEKGIVIPREQLFWIWNAHKKAMDPDEPYDVGVSNALALALHIVCDRDPVFRDKPEDLNHQIELLNRKIDRRDKKIEKLEDKISTLESQE